MIKEKIKLKQIFKNKKILILILIIILLCISTIMVNVVMPQITQYIIKPEQEELLKYEIKEYMGEGRLKILIKMQDEEGIDYIKYPNGDILYANGKKIVGIDYEINASEEYKFKIKSKEKKQEVEENIYIELNEEWREILRLAGLDETKYESYEKALEDSEVTKAVGSHEEALDCLLNSSDEIIETTIQSQEMLKELAKNEYSAKKIMIYNDKWFEKIYISEQSPSFFNNINIRATEILNYVEGEHPYYTFEAKENKSYFIQCYGAQGGSYSTTLQGGYGGYSFGIYKPTQNKTLYIYLGGAGKGNIIVGKADGGYNGGGAIIGTWGDDHERRGTGGGATHIALRERLISKFRRI